MRFSIAGNSGLSWRECLDLARACEELGFYGFYPADHLMQVGGGFRGLGHRGSSNDRLDGPTLLAGLAGYTTRLRLGVLVMGNLFRHPVMTAKIFTTLDHLSGGRAELGIGASWSKEEHLVNGFPYPPLAERVARLDEALAVIKSLWTQERTSFNGKYYTLQDAPFGPKPFQQPHPPIIVGGNNVRTLRVAARHADEWNVMGALGMAAACIQEMRRVCQETGRDFAALPVSHTSTFLLADSKADVQGFLDHQVASMAASSVFKLLPQYPTVEAQARDETIIGGAEEVVAQVGRWRELGVTHLYLIVPRPFRRETLERFAAQVMPAFR